MDRGAFGAGGWQEPAFRLRPPLRTDLAKASSHSANERFKTSFGPAFRLGLLIALSGHYVVLTAFPSLHAAEAAGPAREVRALELPPTLEIPKPPEPVARPAMPRIGDLSLSEQLTIAPTTFEAFEPAAVSEDLAPPPVTVVEERERPQYIPYEVPPRLKNAEEMISLLEGAYPASLRDAGIGGSVRLWVYVDERGIVQDAQVDVSSGFAGLDEAARTVAHAMRFTPALNRDKATPVWISQPIEFITK